MRIVSPYSESDWKDVKGVAEANRKFFGKNRALNALVAEVQSFAFFDVQVSQIPAIIADIALYQKEVASVT